MTETFTTAWNWTGRALLVASVVGAVAGAAQTALGDEPARLQGDFGQPLQGREMRAADNNEARVSWTSVVIDNGVRYEVRSENGDVTAQRDGVELPAERVRVRDGSVEILDEAGNVERTISVPGSGNRGAVRVFRRGGGAGENFFDSIPMPPPVPDIPGRERGWLPVMLGITMSDGPDGVIVESVREDLPAAQAGIEVNDIIVELDGEPVRTGAQLREHLSKRKPGDKVNVKLWRNGEPLTIAVELQQFDAERLGSVRIREFIDPEMLRNMPGLDEQNLREFMQFPGEAGDSLNEAQEVLREALTRVQNPDTNLERTREIAAEALQSALAAVERAREQGARGMVFLAPQPPPTPQAQDDLRRQLDNLRQDLEALRNDMRERRSE